MGRRTKIKDFRYRNNTFPETVDFWAAFKAGANSATNIAGLLWDQSITENFDISNTELRDAVADPTTIINAIATDKGITVPEAELIFKNNPSWIDVENSEGHAPYDPTILN